ncbi:MAG: hypothetical protein QG574_4955 [Cyanobacteriota bacterium erpe_2018_sw_21hr_WHONDRS-SW48-000092_B_bin.40]|nr:hypothetical protein [Cyanobacteriota bacterium erpe_2018_sw_21hr_WHONDRS-SW48-000092_B_bin.40]
MKMSKLAVSLSVSLISLASIMAPQNIGCQAQEIQAAKSNGPESTRESTIEGTLNIDAQGFNSTPVDIALFKSSQKTNPYRQQSINTKDGKARVTFTQIPLGDYAIRVSTTGKKVKVKLTADTYSQNEDRIFGPIWKKNQFHMNKAEMTVVLTAIK